jgi:hypothetical protein
MPKEVQTRKKAVDFLQNKGWVVWYPAKVKFKQNDIFGIIDLLALRGKKMRYIQLTTPPNVSRCRKKILGFFKKNKVSLPVEIWYWHKAKKFFKIIFVTNKRT